MRQLFIIILLVFIPALSFSQGNQQPKVEPKNFARQIREDRKDIKRWVSGRKFDKLRESVDKSYYHSSYKENVYVLTDEERIFIRFMIGDYQKLLEDIDSNKYVYTTLNFSIPQYMIFSKQERYWKAVSNKILPEIESSSLSEDEKLLLKVYYKKNVNELNKLYANIYPQHKINKDVNEVLKLTTVPRRKAFLEKYVRKYVYKDFEVGINGYIGLNFFTGDNKPIDYLGHYTWTSEVFFKRILIGLEYEYGDVRLRNSIPERESWLVDDYLNYDGIGLHAGYNIFDPGYFRFMPVLGVKKCRIDYLGNDGGDDPIENSAINCGLIIDYRIPFMSELAENGYGFHWPFVPFLNPMNLRLYIGYQHQLHKETDEFKYNNLYFKLGWGIYFFK